MAVSEPGCIFCRIVTGEAPADVVHSTDQVLAFRDINPQAPVHVQVVPRRHVSNASTLGPEDGELLAELVIAAREVAGREGIAGRGYRLLFNVGEDARSTIPHLHLHVLGGRRLGWPPG
ncbi:MAG: histidine triad nucleotide-binding protein [Acidimicrobiales bacterium]|jgi:histidine triad (HIT) family protein